MDTFISNSFGCSHPWFPSGAWNQLEIGCKPTWTSKCPKNLSSKTMQHTALTDSRLKILARFGILSPSWPGPCCPWFWNASFRKIFGPDGRYWFSQTYLVLIRGWQWYWWHYYVVDFMMVTDFRCWLPNHYVGDFFRYVGDFLKVLNRSPTSQTCHQHIWSPTSVTNIDVTENVS